MKKLFEILFREPTTENYREFKKVFCRVKEIARQGTLQEVDMAAGFLLGITEEKYSTKKINAKQKETLEEMIEIVWNDRRDELERDEEELDKFFEECL